MGLPDERTSQIGSTVVTEKTKSAVIHVSLQARWQLHDTSPGVHSFAPTPNSNGAFSLLQANLFGFVQAIPVTLPSLVQTTERGMVEEAGGGLGGVEPRPLFLCICLQELCAQNLG